LWVPFFAFAGLIVWMYHVLAHRPGGQPIAALEFAASKSWRFIRGIIPRRAQA